jgi:hypothetical protein
MSSTVTSIGTKVPKTFEIGDLVEVNKGNWIDKQGKIAETAADGTSRVEGLGWCMNEDLDLVEAVTSPPAPEPEPEADKIRTDVDGEPADVVLNGKSGAPVEEEQKNPPLIEVTINELNQDWVNQYDRWAAAESEAKEAREEATLQRKRLDALSQQMRYRLRRDSVAQQTSLLDQQPSGSETPEAQTFQVRRSFALAAPPSIEVWDRETHPERAAQHEANAADAVEMPLSDDTEIEPS